MDFDPDALDDVLADDEEALSERRASLLNTLAARKNDVAETEKLAGSLEAIERMALQQQALGAAERGFRIGRDQVEKLRDSFDAERRRLASKLALDGVRIQSLQDRLDFADMDDDALATGIEDLHIAYEGAQAKAARLGQEGFGPESATIQRAQREEEAAKAEWEDRLAESQNRTAEESMSAYRAKEVQHKVAARVRMRADRDYRETVNREGIEDWQRMEAEAKWKERANAWVEVEKTGPGDWASYEDQVKDYTEARAAESESYLYTHSDVEGDIARNTELNPAYDTDLSPGFEKGYVTGLSEAAEKDTANEMEAMVLQHAQTKASRDVLRHLGAVNDEGNIEPFDTDTRAFEDAE
jgi:hypothetical protein